MKEVFEIHFLISNFFEVGFKSKEIQKKFFFTFLVLQFNNQIWKMKDIF